MSAAARREDVRRAKDALVLILFPFVVLLAAFSEVGKWCGRAADAYCDWCNR